MSNSEGQSPERAYDDPEGLVNVFRSEERKKAENEAENLQQQLDLQKKIVKKIKEREAWEQGEDMISKEAPKEMVKVLNTEIEHLRAELEELKNK